MRQNYGQSPHDEREPIGRLADRYHIVVNRERIDDEWYFVGRVAEFPDVAVFESTKIAAYDSAYSVVSGLLETYRVQRRSPPVPAR